MLGLIEARISFSELFGGLLKHGFLTFTLQNIGKHPRLLQLVHAALPLQKFAERGLDLFLAEGAGMVDEQSAVLERLEPPGKVELVNGGRVQLAAQVAACDQGLE